ncbi:unnamed protein product [Fraxinus pennsylvanica]|uniref:Isopenicillin N synthase-like Fe(2+) 2OG dioxygenase domain-containing protein n=1 Tax=Fraxinus pennsylvanica TaxID=56036 RepID=A0AAD2A3V2_9LAMI|nr:unnamed protein product [Fraxinus pennsylvanica]
MGAKCSVVSSISLGLEMKMVAANVFDLDENGGPKSAGRGTIVKLYLRPSWGETLKEYIAELEKLAVKSHGNDEVKGLQILKDGKWIDEPMKNAIVINTGDQIEFLSYGSYKSFWHRVFALTNGNQRSPASFYNPSLNANIGPARTC